MSDKLARRRSLESFKKEAKRWFAALRRNVPDARTRFERAVTNAPAKPILRDVQHALAREHGFAGWTELKHKLTADAEETQKALGQLEEMAEALLEAYRTGTPAAMERHWALTWHRRNHQAMRTYVQLDLGRQAGADNQNDDITLDDARYLVAREHGFERWDDLVKFYASVPTQASLTMTKPIGLFFPDAVGDEWPAWDSRDWSAVVSRLKECAAAGIDAAGQMTDAMIEDVSRIEHLTALKLGGSRGVTDAGVCHLARLSRLRYLDLSGTSITDRGLDFVRALPELETVSLAWTNITDAGAANLSGCRRLRNVDLSGTSTGDGALRALTEKAHLCQLRTGNGVTDAGLALLHEIPIFKSWHGGEPTMGLLSYHAGPNYLLLRGPFTDRGMTQLEGLCGLFALNLARPKPASPRRGCRRSSGCRTLAGSPSMRPTKPCRTSLAWPDSASSVARTPSRVMTDSSH